MQTRTVRKATPAKAQTRNHIPKSSKLMPYRFTSLYTDFANLKVSEVLLKLGSSPSGLTEDEALNRQSIFGRNELTLSQNISWHTQLLKGFVNPFILLLIGLAIVSYATNDIPGAVIVTIMVLASTVLTFIQEYRSNNAAERLKEMVTTTTTVLRQTGSEDISGPIDIPISTLVPGDVITLAAGDMIPADLRLLSSKDLFISQAPLTGESLPIEKRAIVKPGIETSGESVLEKTCLCFMGSNVISGSATAVILKTGNETYLGSIAKSVGGQRVRTSFDKGINKFTWLMLRFMLIMVPLVFVVNGIAKGNWTEAFMFAIAVAVGLTPEMLPMIVTVNLAKGALAMSKQKVIVKRLHSIQNFGAMDVLCTDKTGTLTQDEVALEKYIDISSNESQEVLRFAYLNSFYQTGLRNLLDKAILKHVDIQDNLNIKTDYRKIDEIPFDFERRRMSVIVEERKESGHLLICKGALEEILAITKYVDTPEGRVEIDEQLAIHLKRLANSLNADGLRVLAVGYKRTPGTELDYGTKDESDLTLAGYIGFLDPPKESAKLAVAALHKFGVGVKVLTGDNHIVTRKIAKEVGLRSEIILLGPEIDQMSDAELSGFVSKVDVFAKLTPAQKQRIIQSLQSVGHVVGFLGDGINDAPALRAADVGISVDNAVDIAKESADIILLEKDLMVLEKGALEGRKVFGNIVKYVKMGASSNFGNMFSVLGASVLLPFLPMLPVQLLVQNLLYDLSQTAIPLDQVDEEYLAKPRRWEIADIGRFMVCIGPVSSLFDYATFAVMYFIFHARTPAQQSLFQSGWFIEGLLSQTLVVHIIRTQKIPFVQSRASWPLIVTTSLIMMIGIYIPFSSLAPIIGLVALPFQYFAWLAVFLIAYAILTNIVKNWFVRKFGFN